MVLVKWKTFNISSSCLWNRSFINVWETQSTSPNILFILWRKWNLRMKKNIKEIKMHKFLLKYLCTLHWSFMMSLQKMKDVCDGHLTFCMMQILSTLDESYNVMTKTNHLYPMIFPKNPSKCFFLQVHCFNISVHPPYIVLVLIYTNYFDVHKWFCLYHEAFTSRSCFWYLEGFPCRWHYTIIFLIWQWKPFAKMIFFF